MLSVLLVMSGLLISFFLSWISYYYAAEAVSVGGIPSDECMIIAGIETFFLALIYMIYLIPSGLIFAGFLSLLLPYVILKMLKKRLDAGWIVPSVAFVMVWLVKLVFIVPFYLIG